MVDGSRACSSCFRSIGLECFVIVYCIASHWIGALRAQRSGAAFGMASNCFPPVLVLHGIALVYRSCFCGVCVALSSHHTGTFFLILY